MQVLYAVNFDVKAQGGDAWDLAMQCTAEWFGYLIGESVDSSLFLTAGQRPLSPHNSVSSRSAAWDYVAGEGARAVRIEVRDETLADEAIFVTRATVGDTLGRTTLRVSMAYFSRVGSANGALVERLQKVAQSPAHADTDDQAQLLTYVIGHVLCNAILKYPGPLLDASVLAAYVSHAPQSAEQISELFLAARYAGPFSEDGRFFWRADVDAFLDELPRPKQWEEFAPADVQNRRLVELALGGALPRHACDRCNGERGGYWCPFSQRAVCEQSDCSVASSSWIPDGAWLARVERDFYDEWSPMLGH